MMKSGMTDWIAGGILCIKYGAEVQTIRPPLSVLIDHIEYVIKLVGVDYVGLGSDFDGIEFAPVGLDDVSCYPLVTKALLERGYSKMDITKILGGNLLRVLKANEEHGRGLVGQAPRHGEGRAADQGPGDHAHLPGDRIERDRTRQDGGRDEIGAIEPKGGHGEGAANAEQDRDREQGRQRHRVHQHQRGERGGADHFRGQADPDDPAPVDAVGDIAGEQGQQEQRQELGEADHAEPELACSIDMPRSARAIS